MSNTQMGQMSSEVLEIVDCGGGDFILTMRLADGRAVRTKGRATVSADGERAGQRSFDFDSEDFQKEVMKGNIDIRAVCAALGRTVRAPE